MNSIDLGKEGIEILKKYLDLCNIGPIANMGAHFTVLFDTVYSFNKTKHPLVLEIGRGEEGGSLFALALACKLTEGKVISVDVIESTKTIDELVAKLELTDEIEFITMDDRDPKLIKLLSAHKRKFDVIFLDSSHTETHTKQELKTFYSFLEKGGFFMFHDCPNINYLVEDIVDEFVETHPDLVVVSKRKYSDGLTILKKLE